VHKTSTQHFYGRPKGQAIIFCRWGFFFFLLLFSLAYSQRSQLGCLPYFHTWCDLSANLECRSEMCRMRLTDNTGRKNSPSAHHSTSLSGYIFATKEYIDNRKNLLHSNRPIFSTCSHFGQLTAQIGWRVWGTPANFNGFRVFPSLLHRRRSTEINRTLHDVWPSPGLVHYRYVYILGALGP